MSEPITIVRLGPGDLDRLLAVGEGLFDAPLRRDQAAAFLADPMHELMLAYAGGHAVGMVSAMVQLHPDKAPAMFIAEVGTRARHQRKGIATALMRAMIAHGRARGCEGIWLGTEPDNAAALGLYRKLGADEVAGVYFGWDSAFDAE